METISHPSLYIVFKLTISNQHIIATYLEYFALFGVWLAAVDHSGDADLPLSIIPEASVWWRLFLPSPYLMRPTGTLKAGDSAVYAASRLSSIFPFLLFKFKLSLLLNLP